MGLMESRATVAIPPGETIKEILEFRGIRQKEFALRMDMSEKHISRLINGEVLLTSETASKLEIVLGMEASFWMNLEAIYRQDLLKVQNEVAMDDDILLMMRFPYEEMSKLGWVSDTTDAIEKVKNLCRFFEVLKLTILKREPLWPKIACKLLSIEENTDIAIIIWAQKARIEARKYDVTTKALKNIKKSLETCRKYLLDNDMLSLQAELLQYGVVLLQLETVGNQKIQGISFVDGKRAVIAVNSSLTGVELQKTIAHELAHVVLGHIELKNGFVLEAEEAAENWAQSFLG